MTDRPHHYFANVEQADADAERLAMSKANPGESVLIADAAYDLVDEDPFAVVGYYYVGDLTNRTGDFLVAYGKCSRHRPFECCTGPGYSEHLAKQNP